MIFCSIFEWSIFERYTNKVTIFRKSSGYFDYKMRTNLTADTHGRSFQQKTVSLWKNEVFGLFSGDKGDNIDMWMIKITIKENQIDMDVLLIPEVDNIQRPCLSLKSSFFH